MATMFLNEIPELECSNEVIQGLVGILVRSSLLGRNVSLNRGSGSLKLTYHYQQRVGEMALPGYASVLPCVKRGHGDLECSTDG